jgi:hypothetical protein
MESTRKHRLGRDLWATACRLADAASAKAGYRVGTDQVFRALAGIKPSRGGIALRAAVEEGGYFAPFIEDDR